MMSPLTGLYPLLPGDATANMPALRAWKNRHCNSARARISDPEIRQGATGFNSIRRNRINSSPAIVLADTLISYFPGAS